MIKAHLRRDVPWMVHELDGPVEGLVSQNCVWRSKPYDAQQRTQSISLPVAHTMVGNGRIRTPGDSKQHRSFSVVVLWHDAGPLVEQPELIRLKRSNGLTDAGDGLAEAEAARAAPKARVAASIPDEHWLDR